MFFLWLMCFVWVWVVSLIHRNNRDGAQLPYWSFLIDLNECNMWGEVRGRTCFSLKCLETSRFRRYFPLVRKNKKNHGASKKVPDERFLRFLPLTTMGFLFPISWAFILAGLKSPPRPCVSCNFAAFTALVSQSHPRFRHVMDRRFRTLQ